jgi:hypothetical protein
MERQGGGGGGGGGVEKYWNETKERSEGHLFPVALWFPLLSVFPNSTFFFSGEQKQQTIKQLFFLFP